MPPPATTTSSLATVLSLFLLLIPILSLALPSPPSPANPPEFNSHRHQQRHQRPLSSATITIDLGITHQTISGFGFSSAFQRSSQIRGSKGLSPTNTTYVLDLLFSRTHGMGASILRNGVGSSLDTSRDFMNSIAPNPPVDGEMQYVWDGNDTDQLWLSQMAYGYGVRTFYASAWSSPWYMKSNRNDSNGGYLCGVGGVPSGAESPTGAVDMCAEGEDWKQTYAEYLAQYVKFYREAGIEVTHVGFLNEPDLNVTYASMQSDGYQAGEVVKSLRSVLDEEGLEGVKTVCCEATGWRQQAGMLAEMEEVEDAMESLDVVTGHGYASDPKLPLSEKEVWQSEWADLDGDWRTGWDVLGKAGEGLVWANKIQDAIVLSEVSGFLYWQGAENSSVNSMLIRINGDSVDVSKRLWAMAGWSRWVRPAAMRVGATNDFRELLYTSAFVNVDGGEEGGPGAGGGEVVVVTINNAHVDMEVQFSVNGLDGRMVDGNVQQYVTNNDMNSTDIGSVAMDESGVFSVMVPKRSMVTYVL